ncbi:M48 family metallopeptidase [Corynebacterium aquilae]|uniref:Metal-dependent hydrolase n=1 Tax=Corynebacterium aquilae DSM 44791 TaxID=1431546 RepID=A0A1L7CEG1_9CORY|nr:M48 family metallopeptidase [Corynebacterium aquilae]APT84217.1 metal-dependent hydrolase [Corynebacterium aquilae DSM 44791]
MTRPHVTIIRSPRRRKTVSARHVGDTIEVRLPAGLSASEEQRHIDSLVKKLTNRTTSGARASDADLERRAHTLNAQYLESKARCTSIRWVGNQKTRWGSCTTSTGAIRISDRLKKAPDYVIDAVIVHELVHTFHPGGHDAEFYAWADRVPHAERAKGYLQAYAQFLNHGGPAGNLETFTTD